jgi:hypothetical protein
MGLEGFDAVVVREEEADVVALDEGTGSRGAGGGEVAPFIEGSLPGGGGGGVELGGEGDEEGERECEVGESSNRN